MRTAVFLDLDGTLWDAFAIPPSTARAIKAVRANGHRVFVNTGRSQPEVTGFDAIELDSGCYAAGAEVVVNGHRIVDRPLGEKMTHLVTLTPQGPGCAEATSSLVDKGLAMEEVRRHLGKTAWQTMALGDSENDISMLRAADISVAMGNASDAAKDAASWVTDDIWNDGLLHAFQHFGLCSR